MFEIRWLFYLRLVHFTFDEPRRTTVRNGNALISTVMYADYVLVLNVVTLFFLGIFV